MTSHSQSPSRQPQVPTGFCRYNIEGVAQDLKFTSTAVAGIFLGTVKKWNDRGIASANPGVTLPAADIVVVHRSDGSGTSCI